MARTFTRKQKINYLFSLPVVIAALGYFVDIYDLLLFGIVRVPSLVDLGLDPDTTGITILNWQMFGILLGGILWGVLGDKRGRRSVLFGSIIVYSLANVACGFLPFMHTPYIGEIYMALRFIAGIGLAGEVGAGVTLVSESLPKELRALGTSLVAGFGFLGAVFANFTMELVGSWHITYWIGGIMGIALLFMRASVYESRLYQSFTVNKTALRGNLTLFFTSRKRFLKYLKCLMLALPSWYLIGILAMLGNEFGKAKGMTETLKPGIAIMWLYVGLSVGDFFVGFISTWLRSGKKAILYMMLFTIVGVLCILFAPFKTGDWYYFFCFWIGLGSGYWIMFVTVSAEQFGTNLRATVATTAPNFARGFFIVISFLYTSFRELSDSVILSGAVVGAIVYACSLYAVITIPETYAKNLDFIEE